MYAAPVEAGSRSAMNVVFRLRSEALEAMFLAEAKAQGMVGLAGHRSVGGIRASLYNAIDVPAAVTLASSNHSLLRLFNSRSAKWRKCD